MKRPAGPAAPVFALTLSALAAGGACGAKAGVAVSAPTPAPVPAAVLERELSTMAGWYAGAFDNAEQVFFAKELGRQPGEGPGRIGVVVRPIALAALGRHVFVVRAHADNNPAKPIRLAVHAFSVDAAAGVIRMQVFSVKAPADLAADPAPALADLTPRDGCTLRWRRQGGQFTASAPAAAACPLDLPAMMIGADALWLGDPAGDPARLLRARQWTCWMAVPRTEPKADGGESWFYARDLKINDQGGEVFVTTDDPQPRTFGYRLRQVKWPTGTNADALTLYVLRQGEARAISYAWADPEARRIGINLRTLQGSCSL